jgi:hypothetical protein
MEEHEAARTISSAREEIDIANKIRYRLSTVGSEQRTAEYLNGSFKPSGLSGLELSILDGYRKRYRQVSGSILRIVKQFEVLIDSLAFRLGIPLGLEEDMKSEAFRIIIEALKEYNNRKCLHIEKVSDRFNIFMSYRIRSGLYLYFLRNKFNLAIPRRILLAASYFYKAQSILEKHGISDEVVARVLDGTESIEKMELTDTEKAEIERCKGRLESISNYPLKGASKKPEGVDRIVTQIRSIEEIQFANIDWTGASYEPQMEKYVAISQMMGRIRKEFGEKAFKCWLLRQFGYRLNEINSRIPCEIGNPGISYRIRRIEKFIEEFGQEYVSGGVKDEDVRDYLEAQGATG